MPAGPMAVGFHRRQNCLALGDGYAACLKWRRGDVESSLKNDRTSGREAPDVRGGTGCTYLGECTQSFRGNGAANWFPSLLLAR